MKRKILRLTGIFICVLLLSSCGGPYRGTHVRGSSSFYHSTYGHGWGGGYYYDRRDAIDTIDTVDTIDAIDTMDAMDGMGMPDMDF